MRLLGRNRLSHLYSKNEQIENWVRSWTAEVLAAHWKHPVDVQGQFPNAHHQCDGVFMFPVGSCNWAICVHIAYPQGVALITELKIKDDK